MLPRGISGQHPYTKIEFVQRDLKVSRLTATKYMDALAYDGFVQKHKVGRNGGGRSSRNIGSAPAVQIEGCVR